MEDYLKAEKDEMANKILEMTGFCTKCENTICLLKKGTGKKCLLKTDDASGEVLTIKLEK